MNTGPGFPGFLGIVNIMRIMWRIFKPFASVSAHNKHQTTAIYPSACEMLRPTVLTPAGQSIICDGQVRAFQGRAVDCDSREGGNSTISSPSTRHCHSGRKNRSPTLIIFL
jgi:hypothetical protein